MKQAITIIIFFAATTLQAQTKDPVLNQRIAEYMQLSKTLDAAKLADYLYPRIFELAPRAAIISQLKNAFNNPDITVAIDSAVVLNMDNITTAGTTSFSRMKYLSAMSMKFAQKDSAEDMTGFYMEAFKAKFGAQNVSYEGGNNTFHIKAIKYALAVKDRYSKNNWTFIGIEKDSQLKKLLPVAAVKKYKL